MRHQVYFSNDRERIFAIGYPVLTLFDHFVHLAELATFGGAAFLVVLIGTAMFTRIARQRPRVGRALLREIRASFYRKLFLAFVLAAIIPVLTLALVIRTYFANLLQADVEAEAARTAAIAQRVIEDLDTGLRRSTETAGTLDDDWMVWISQVIDQDVNVFRGAKLAATSERALFASGVLPTRTPDDVYRAIVLQRLPSFVREDAIGVVQLHARRRAGARRRTGCARHGAAHPSPARDRARDRRARSRRPSRRRCSSCWSARRSGCRWPSASPIRCAA